MGEANDHNDNGEAVYACFTKHGDTHKAKHLTVKEFMAEHGYIPAKQTGETA